MDQAENLRELVKNKRQEGQMPMPGDGDSPQGDGEEDGRRGLSVF